MLKKNFAVFTMLIGMPISLLAARPFFTDDAGTVERSAFELESASDYWKDFASFGTTLKHGLTDKMDLGISFGYLAVPLERRAAQPLELSLKYNFVPEHFSASFTGSFSSATYAVNAIYTHSFKAFSGHANMGFEAADAIREMVLTYGLAAVYNLGIAAIGAEIGGVDGELNFWQFGFQINLLQWLAFDTGIGGDFGDETQVSITSGLWFSFGGN